MSCNIGFSVVGIRTHKNIGKLIETFNCLKEEGIEPPQGLLDKLGIEDETDIPSPDGTVVNLADTDCYVSEGDVDSKGGETMTLDLQKLPEGVNKIRVRIYWG